MEIFNHCLGHGRRSSSPSSLGYLSLCAQLGQIDKPMPPPPAPSYSNGGSSQPLIPDTPTYVGSASLWTNLNFSLKQVSLVWERLFSASLFYIWLYNHPISCTALTHEANFQSHSLLKYPYNYNVIFNLNLWNRNDKKTKVDKIFMQIFLSESLGNPEVC